MERERLLSNYQTYSMPWMRMDCFPLPDSSQVGWVGAEYTFIIEIVRKVMSLDRNP